MTELLVHDISHPTTAKMRKTRKYGKGKSSNKILEMDPKLPGKYP